MLIQEYIGYLAKGRQPRVGVRITVSLIFVPEPESRCFINPLKIIIVLD